MVNNDVESNILEEVPKLKGISKKYMIMIPDKKSENVALELIRTFSYEDF